MGKADYGGVLRPTLLIRAAHLAVGDLTVIDDGGEATVYIDEHTHHHVSPYDDELSEADKRRWIVENVTDFLVDLFSNRIVIHIHVDGRSGGWERVEEAPKAVPRGREGRFLVWSGPLES
jgi:hypothetical protein